MLTRKKVSLTFFRRSERLKEPFASPEKSVALRDAPTPRPNDALIGETGDWKLGPAIPPKTGVEWTGREACDANEGSNCKEIIETYKKSFFAISTFKNKVSPVLQMELRELEER